MAIPYCPRTRVHRVLDQLQLELAPKVPDVPQSVSPSGREANAAQPLYWAAFESA